MTVGKNFYANSDSRGFRAGDAIIAATAVEINMRLVSGNARCFRSIK